MTRSLAWLSLVTCSLASTCSVHRVKLAAEGTGDVSNPPAPRGAPDEEVSKACGDGQVTSSRLVRRPYLQQVSGRTAHLSFTQHGDEPVVVDVFLPGGKPVLSRLATREAPGSPLRVEIGGLEPATIYCYRLNGLTESAGFRTAPAPVRNTHTRFVAFGDSGNGSDNQRAVFAQIQTVPYDLVLHLGDLAYEKGSSYELESHYFDVYRRLGRSFSVFPVIGNHDNSTAQATPFLSAFDLPDNGVESERERFYSFNWGPVHFVALDTERIDGRQAAWLDQDLTRQDSPWVVVYGHRPAYSSGSHGGDPRFRAELGPVLEKHHVPLVLSGHEHDYERTKPIAGTVYVVSGGGGRDTRPVSWSDFTAYAEDVLHFVFVEADASTLTLHAIDGVGREFDSLRLTR
jgi:hypothetical protein